MHHSRRKSFDWYGLKQHFSIRKYHFGAASVLLGMSIALGTGTQVVQAAETVTTPESTSVASSTSATESTTSETSTETATSSSSERTVEIGYIVKYATEDGTLVNASVETVSVTTTETIAKATVSVTAVVPEGYELAAGQAATVSQEVTENGVNIVTVKVVKKAEEKAATAKSTEDAATTIATVSEAVKTPATVEEAKVVLEQVTSEAEVLASEGTRQLAKVPAELKEVETPKALEEAVKSTEEAAKEATTTFKNDLATLEEINEKIQEIRNNVEALGLQLRKLTGKDYIEVSLTTGTSTTSATSIDINNPNSVAYAQQGVWEIPDPVKAANSGLRVADQPATIQEADKNYPAGYSGDQDPNRDTFLIYSLDTLNGYGDGNNFNDWVGKNYYITFSVSTDKAEREANDVVYAKLVEKTANGDNVVNTIQLTPGVKNNFDELKVLEGDKKHNTTYSFLYTVQTTGGTTRNLSISNTNGNNQNTHLYNKSETAKVGTKYNSSTAFVPGTTTQTTTYYVKENADTDRPREMLAKYTQKDGLVGDKFHIAGPIDFNNYELISSELPTVTSGILAPDYTKGAQWFVLRGNHNEARLLTITDEDGSLQYQMYMLDPQNPNWANFYKNNMEKATIADLKDYFKLMFTSEVIAPGNKNTKEGLFEEKFYEANKLVLENTIVQVLDKNGDVLGTLSDDKTTINVPNGENISVAKATDTMVTDVNGDLYTVNHLKVYKTDAAGNYVDAAGNILTPLKWNVNAPQRIVNGEYEIYPGYGTKTSFTTDTIRVETGPWDKANMNEATESVWYYGWNYHTASDETRLTDTGVISGAKDDSRWDVGGLEMSMPNNNLKNEQHVRYWYAEKGGVEVYYVTSDGTVLTDFTAKDGSTVADKNVIVDHGDTNSAYDTTSVRYESITAADGTVYYYKEIDTTAANLHPVVNDTMDKDYRATEKIDAETGIVKTDTVKQITYVYEKAGNVVVNYVTEDGTELSGITDKGTPTGSTVDFVKNGKPGTDYDTNNLKPATIQTADGKTYKYKEVDSTKAQPTGQVEAGVTKEVTYIYEEVKGNVVVKYVDANGKPISGTADKGIDGKEKEVASEVEDTPLSSTTNTGNGYDTTDNRPETITTADGTVYKLVPAATQGNETGDIVEGTTTVTYVYVEVAKATGSVVVRYVEAGNESNVLKDPVLDENAVVTGTKYDTTDEGDKPAEIVKDGVRYVLVPSKTTAVDPNGNPVTETGEVAEGTTVVTYKYQKVANWIPQIPGVPEGQEPKVPYPFDPTNPDKPIDPTTPYPDGEVPSIPHVPGYTPVDPKTNEPLKPVDPTDPSKGYVPPTPDETGVDTPLPYVQTGNVVVNYVDENGNVIKAPVKDETDAPAGKSYDTTDNKPTEIVTEDGTRYVLIPSKIVGSETGTVEGGKTTEITYVYKKVANWIPQIPGVPAGEEPKVPYPFDPTNPDKPIDPTTPGTNGEVPSIPHVPGYTPVDPKTNEPLKPVDPTDPSKGYVPPTPDETGVDTPIPYVQNGNVVVNYVDENGNVIKAPVQDETNVPAGKSYDTTDNKPTEIVTEDGSRYVLIPSKTVGSETGTVEGGKTTEITYVYKKVANWIPQIPGVPAGEEPKVPYPFDPENPDKPIDPTTPGTNGEVPSIPYVPGYTPVDPKTDKPLKPIDPTDPGKGYVPPTPDETGVDTPVPYVQNGNVVVNYVDENGNVLKTPVNDETDAPAGKSYDTTDNKPVEIVTEDGSRYVLIPSKTIGTENGTVEGGKTIEITYVYKKVANWIPQIPGVPAGEEPKVPYPFDPTTPDVPVTPTPDTVIPNVPGYTPVDPKTNEPLKPVDPTDPGKGYVPPTPDDSGVDTPVPYVQNGNVVVNYVTEDGTVIKSPVKDETDAPAGKSYDTTDNKPNTITTEDGTTYELVRVDGSETGTVVGGKTTEVTYVYRKVTPAKKVVTNHVDENGTPIAPQEEGTTPNKSIPGYEFTGKTVTDPDGNTTHIYRKVKKVVTNHVDEDGNPIAPQEEGTTPNKSIPGYEFTGKTYTDGDGNTYHVYRKVNKPVAPKPQAPVAPTTTTKTGVAQLPNTGEASSSATVLGAGMLIAALALAGKRRRNED